MKDIRDCFRARSKKARAVKRISPATRTPTPFPELGAAHFHAQVRRGRDERCRLATWAGAGTCRRSVYCRRDNFASSSMHRHSGADGAPPMIARSPQIARYYVDVARLGRRALCVYFSCAPLRKATARARCAAERAILPSAGQRRWLAARYDVATMRRRFRAQAGPRFISRL